MKRLLLLCIILACPFILQANPYKPIQHVVNPTHALHEQIVDISELPGSDLLVTFDGALFGDPVIGERFGLAKLDHDGSPIWVFNYPLPHNSIQPAAAVGTADGGAWLFVFPDEDAPAPGLRAIRINSNGDYVSNVFITLPFQPVGKLDAWPIADEGVLIEYRLADDPTMRLMRINTAGDIVWVNSTPIRGEHKIIWQDEQNYSLFGLTDSTLVYIRKNTYGATLLTAEFDEPTGSQFLDAVQTDGGHFYAMTLRDSEHPFIRTIHADGSAGPVISPTITEDTPPRLLAPSQNDEEVIVIYQYEHEPAFWNIPALVAFDFAGEVNWRQYVDIESPFGIDFSTGVDISADGMWFISDEVFKLIGIIHDAFLDPMILPTFHDTWLGGYHYEPYVTSPVQLDVQPPTETVERPENGDITLLFKIWNNVGQEMDLDVWYEYGWYQGYFEPMILPYTQYSAPAIEELIVPDEDYVTLTRTYTTPDLPAFVTNRQVIVRVTVGIYPYQVFAYDYFSIDVEPEAANVAGDAGIVASALPTEFALGTVYPNPFNSSTRVSVTLPEAANLQVNVYDLTGRLVASLADGVYPAGAHNLTLNADHLASGVYFLRATVPGQLDATRKLVLVR